MTRTLVAALALLPAVLMACGRSEPAPPRPPSVRDAGRVDGAFPAGHDASEEPGADVAVKPLPDAALLGTDAGFTDAGPKPDWDAGTGTCSSWKVEPRSITAVRLAAGSFATPRQGSSVMLDVDVQLLSGCEKLAKVDVALMPGNATNFVTLGALARVLQDGPCEPEATIVTTGAMVPGRGMGNPRVVVSAVHSPGGGLRLTYDVETCTAESCWCDPWATPGIVPEFQVCGTDCDCAAGLSCLPTLAHDGTVWTCVRPCTKQTECPESGCNLASVTAPWTCGSVDACPYPEDCPAGFSCVIRDALSFCQDERQGPIGARCKCDAECPLGQLCIGPDGWTTCQILCAADRDCPAPYTCGLGGDCWSAE